MLYIDKSRRYTHKGKSRTAFSRSDNTELDIPFKISYHKAIDQQKGGAMQTTISSKYQVVIPKPVREHLNLKPKQKLTVIEKDKMLVLIPHTSLEELRGIAAGADTDDYREKADRI